MDGADASPTPRSKSRHSRVTMLWVSDKLPLTSSTKTRSPGSTNVCILRQTFTWSYPEFVRESDIMTKPSLVMTPKQ